MNNLALLLSLKRDGIDADKYSKLPVYFGQAPAGSYKTRSVKTSGAGKDGMRRKVTYGTGYYYDKNAEDPAVTRQKAFQQQLQATASKSQADIAKQLQIVQNEKSAVSKMTQEYTAMLTAEADRKTKADEAARVAAATSAANQSRQGQTSNLQIQPASGTSKTAGTQPFKRRQLQFNPQTYGGVASLKSGTLNL